MQQSARKLPNKYFTPNYSPVLNRHITKVIIYLVLSGDCFHWLKYIE
jgi:hypothetical protein